MIKNKSKTILGVSFLYDADLTPLWDFTAVRSNFISLLAYMFIDIFHNILNYLIYSFSLKYFCISLLICPTRQSVISGLREGAWRALFHPLTPKTSEASAARCTFPSLTHILSELSTGDHERNQHPERGIMPSDNHARPIPALASFHCWRRTRKPGEEERNTEEREETKPLPTAASGDAACE